jgi:hypothetical protein
MKRIIFTLVCIALIVGAAQATKLTFQQSSDFSQQIVCGGGNCQWVHNASGGNSYVTAQGGTNYIRNSPPPMPMTYSAVTMETDWDVVNLYDSSMTPMWAYTVAGTSGSCYRIEMYMVGGQAYIYRDGTLIQTSSILPQNPSYVGWSSSGNTVCNNVPGISGAGLDDMVFGTTESRYVFGMPESGYFIMKDLINPGASGFYRVNQTNPTGPPDLITSNVFSTSFGKNSGTNETVVLTSPTGGTQLTYSTGGTYWGQIAWNLTSFFNTAPYGLYYTTINPQLNSPGYSVSSYIPYIGNGASISFDANQYAPEKVATLTAIVSDSYYNTTAYSYHMVITDSSMTTKTDQPVVLTSASPHTGNITYTFQATDPDGLYYGEIFATKKSDGSDVLMNYATTSLTSILTVDGYIFNAQTAAIIPNVTVNITQGASTDTNLSSLAGFYSSSSGFTANAPTTINASKVGYESYQTMFTPQYGGELMINITLMPSNPAYSGVALGGIARYLPYNRTIDGATITVNNTPAGNFIVTTNSVGYYVINDMPANYVWNVWGSKSPGFKNSTVYQKLVAGI